MFIKSLFVLSLFFFTLNSFAHGEGAPGPHNGHIKMLGTFHVEAVPVKNNSFHVFLLDVELKNPIVANSTVDLKIENKSKVVTAFKCEAVSGTHFLCQQPKKTDLKSGTLIIKANRAGPSGEARYDLPLKWQKPAPATQPADHSHH
jgi:hypothetical protein